MQRAYGGPTPRGSFVSISSVNLHRNSTSRDRKLHLQMRKHWINGQVTDSKRRSRDSSPDLSTPDAHAVPGPWLPRQARGAAHQLPPAREPTAGKRDASGISCRSLIRHLLPSTLTQSAPQTDQPPLLHHAWGPRSPVCLLISGSPFLR